MQIIKKLRNRLIDFYYNLEGSTPNCDEVVDDLGVKIVF